ncbi:Septin-7 [Echinococcus granulosus]|uniref:Septin n=1 Tax=Echinococcus granulosus TaxID=6210 RepID=A0A068WMW0_ECHGR|nr:Septin-7 [Echinococcus granulosus]CDS21116.1 septin [Echinococcus granulosus]
MSRVITNVTSSSPNSRMVSKDHIRSSSSEASIDKSEPSISFKSKLFANDSSEKENTSNRDSLHNISGKAPVQPKNIFDVGFSKLPKQIYRKTIKRGFTFNIMLVGVAGLGKSTFLNTLFMTDIYNDEFLAPSVRFYKDASAAASVASHTFNLTEQGVALRLTVIDAPGYGEALDNSSCWRLLVEEINRRNAAFMEAESRVQRNTTGSGCGGSGGRLGVTPEDLIHACFYFLSPTGHGVRQMDLEAMRALHDKVNIIPIIAKADTMTVEECRLFKTAVQSQLLREDIHTYDFPLSAIPETSSVAAATSNSRIAEVKRLRLRQPFAVCTSSHVITKEDGSKVRCRVYPWGTVETDSLEHNDFQALKTLLMRHFMQDLIDVTYTKHYANYRTNRLTDTIEAAHFNLQDGREPLSQLDAERKTHQIKLDKLVEEMNQVYVEKVREREKRLKDSEHEMAERVQQMQQQLESEAENIATARQAFNDQRVTWEMENRDYADSVCGSMEKLEKTKKHRRSRF